MRWMAWVGLTVLASGGQTEEERGPAGAISGKVAWEGAVPERRKFQVDRDPAVCGQFKLEESLLVDPKGGVANAVVWLKGVAGGPMLEAAEIDQKGCVFNPHVTLLTRGQGVRVLNPDGVNHCFHLWSRVNDPGNFIQNRFKKVMEVPAAHFQKPEFIRVTCDCYPWMSGWIAVMENGYAARTDAAGHIRIDGIPPGKYVLALWHEPITPEGEAFP